MTLTLIILLGLSIALNLYQKRTQMKTTASGRAALEAIAEISNYVQTSVKESATVTDIQQKLSSDTLKNIAGKIFDFNKVHNQIKKELKRLWEKGKARIKIIL